MNRAFEKELSRALAAEPDTAAPEMLLRRCRAERKTRRRGGWRDLIRCQLKLLDWKSWLLEGAAAVVLYSVGKELALWEKAWTLRNALFALRWAAAARCFPFRGRPGGFFVPPKGDFYAGSNYHHRCGKTRPEKPISIYPRSEERLR